MTQSLNHGFGNVYSLKRNRENGICRSMGRIPIPITQKIIPLFPRLCVGTVIRFCKERLAELEWGYS